jgi:hypothetical protein
MLSDYEARKVLRTDHDDFTIDTAAIPDSDEPFETAIKHPLYYDKWIIVEEYHTKAQAIQGHAEWFYKMTRNPPLELVDVSTSGTAKLNDMVQGNKSW